jgi:hypothetical protein
MTTQAKGTFETKTTPHEPYDTAEGATLGRMTVVKRFAGSLVGDGHVVMIAARSPVPSSAGYVAIERVTGVLDGLRGTFVLQHSGTMNRGASSLTISVVPDTGTDELVGLAGTMTIDVVGGQHFYTFDYSVGV